MTDTQIGAEMADAETLSLLESKGHGVLSMGKDDRGYGIPVSFGYDDVDERVLFEFLDVRDSKKRAFATATEEVTLTVYEFEDQRTWTSAVVTGTLRPVEASDLPERAVSSFATQADDAAEELRWAEAEDLERQWYEIRPTDVTGRRRQPRQPFSPHQTTQNPDEGPAARRAPDTPATRQKWRTK